MLSLEAVEKIYQNAKTTHHVLKNIHLEVEKGEIFGILGRPSSGKTTLLRCVHFLENINSGSISLEHSPFSTEERSQLLARRSQGMVFSDPLLLSSRTVYENVMLSLETSNIKKQEAKARSELALKITFLQDQKNAYPKELSLSQQYRVSIARAIVHQPKIILLDDITKACDAKTSHGLLKLIRELNERYHFTIVLATQQMEVIKSTCHRVAILHEGEIVEEGTVKTVFAHPKTENAKEFIKSSTRMEMPTALRRRLKSQELENTYPVLRLTLDNNPNQESLLAQAIQHYNLNMNILQAHLEAIREDHIGIMVIELRGKKSDIENAIHYLEGKGLHIEVLGYVL